MKFLNSTQILQIDETPNLPKLKSLISYKAYLKQLKEDIKGDLKKNHQDSHRWKEILRFEIEDCNREMKRNQEQICIVLN